MQCGSSFDGSGSDLMFDIGGLVKMSQTLKVSYLCVQIYDSLNHKNEENLARTYIYVTFYLFKKRWLAI
jgi:hypothetical protein